MLTSVYKSATECDEEFVFETNSETMVFVKMIFCDNCSKIHEFILETSISTEINIINDKKD